MIALFFKIFILAADVYMERAVSLVALLDTRPVQKPPLAKAQITRQDPRRKKIAANVLTTLFFIPTIRSFRCYCNLVHNAVCVV